MDVSPLKAELGFFQEMKGEWLKHHNGQFALVRGRQLVGVFTTFQEAYSAGVKQFGNVPMLIRQVLPSDPVEQAPALMHGLIRLNAQ